MSWWQQLLALFASSGFSVGAAAWLASRLVDAKLSQEAAARAGKLELEVRTAVDRARIDLEGRAEQELEGMKAKLSRLTTEHEVVFSRLHERRVDVIESLYEALVDMELAAQAFMSPGQSVVVTSDHPQAISDALRKDEDEKGHTAAAAANAFTSLFTRKRLWLDEATCRILDGIREKHREAWIDFTMYSTEDVRQNRDLSKERTTLRRKAWETVRADLPAMRSHLETTLRTLIGVIRDNNG